ncbi:MAG TPA: PASTA domain-containing protein [Gemmatimonadales bacterium]|nr:PASTA domain-containing protein [Gemmatimonadales bacterium]
MRVRRHSGRPSGGGHADRTPPDTPHKASGGGGRYAHVPDLSPGGRRWLLDFAILVAVFGIGYLGTSVWMSPASIIGADHAVPRVLELTGGEAQRRLAALGFRAKFDESREDLSIPRGSIVWQDPPPGVVLPENSVVWLAPSAGVPQVPVPDVVGLARPQAEKIIVAAGLKIGDVDTIAADPEPNVVVATRPSAGQGRDPGSPIELVVSGRPVVGSGPPPPAPRSVPLAARPQPAQRQPPP